MKPLDLASNWFYQLAQRERIMVSVCAAVIILTLVWTAVIKPIYTGTVALEERVMQKQAQLASLQEQASQIRYYRDASAGANRGIAISDSIVVIIDRATRSRQLQQHLKRNQPDDSGGVRLRFEGAPFDALVGLLGELQRSYGMTMVSGNFDEADTGRVNCSLVIARTGG
jgi:type II secretory pathway component PulM